MRPLFIVITPGSICSHCESHCCRFVAICQGRMDKYRAFPVNIRQPKKNRTEAIFSYENCIFRESAPGGGRTHNLWLRRPTLYPIELRARMDSELATDSPDFHRFSARPRARASARTLRDFGLQKRCLRRKVCARIRARWRRVYEPGH